MEEELNFLLLQNKLVPETIPHRVCFYNHQSYANIFTWTLFSARFTRITIQAKYNFFFVTLLHTAPLRVFFFRLVLLREIKLDETENRTNSDCYRLPFNNVHIFLSFCLFGELSRIYSVR